MKPVPRPRWFRGLLLIAIMAAVVWLTSKQLLVPIADYRWQLPEQYHVNAISSDGSEVITSPRSNSMRAIRDVERDITICDAITGSVKDRLDIKVIKDEISHLSFSPDNRFVIFTQESQQVLYHIASRQSFRFASFPRNVDGTFHMLYAHLMEWALDNKLVTISTPKGVILWDALGFRSIATLPVDGYPKLWFSPQGTSLITLEADRTMKAWDTKTGRELAKLHMVDIRQWMDSSTYDHSCRFIDEKRVLIRTVIHSVEHKRWQDYFLLVDVRIGQLLDELSIDGAMLKESSGQVPPILSSCKVTVRCGETA